MYSLELYAGAVSFSWDGDMSDENHRELVVRGICGGAATKCRADGSPLVISTQQSEKQTCERYGSLQLRIIESSGAADGSTAQRSPPRMALTKSLLTPPFPAHYARG